MRLSAKLLKSVVNVNSFAYTSQWDIAEGNAQRLYFQFVDKHQSDLRYLSQATPLSASVTFDNIDDSLEIVKSATQAFADDKSIWYIDLAADEVPSNGAVQFSFDEDGVVTNFRVDFAITVDLLNAGGC